MPEKYTIQTDDKVLRILGDETLSITIDFDDVDHSTVLRRAGRLCKLLNAADKFSFA